MILTACCSRAVTSLEQLLTLFLLTLHTNVHDYRSFEIPDPSARALSNISLVARMSPKRARVVLANSATWDSPSLPPRTGVGVASRASHAVDGLADTPSFLSTRPDPKHDQVSESEKDISSSSYSQVSDVANSEVHTNVARPEPYKSEGLHFNISNPLSIFQEWLSHIANRIRSPNLERRQSNLLGQGVQSHPRSVFPAGRAGGVMAPRSSILSQGPSGHFLTDKGAGKPKAASSPWSLRSWKKFTLDFYVRLLDRPRDSRFRLKQTVALLPFLKLKPTVDISATPAWQSPVRMRLDVKLLGCLKYRVRQDGSSFVLVRARAPLADPRFAMDVLYVRDLADSSDSVKLTFRALDIAFLKAPRFGAGCKIPINFSSGIKSTIRVKKYLLQESGNGGMGKSSRSNARGNAKGFSDANRGRNDERVESTGTSRQLRSGKRTNNWNIRMNNDSQLGVYGPAGIDIKTRLWEFGNDLTTPPVAVVD